MELVDSNPNVLGVINNTVTCIVCNTQLSSVLTSSNLNAHKRSELHKFCENFPADNDYKDIQERMMEITNAKGIQKRILARFWHSHRSILEAIYGGDLGEKDNFGMYV